MTTSSRKATTKTMRTTRRKTKSARGTRTTTSTKTTRTGSADDEERHESEEHEEEPEENVFFFHVGARENRRRSVAKVTEVARGAAMQGLARAMWGEADVEARPGGAGRRRGGVRRHTKRGDWEARRSEAWRGPSEMSWRAYRDLGDAARCRRGEAMQRVKVRGGEGEVLWGGAQRDGQTRRISWRCGPIRDQATRCGARRGESTRRRGQAICMVWGATGLRQSSESFK